MRTREKDEDNDGHRVVRVNGGAFAIALPHCLADEFAARRRQDLAEAERREDERRAQLAVEQERHVREPADANASMAPAEDVATTVARQLFLSQPGCHRVLSDYRRAVTGDDLGRSADSDVRARMERIRKRLLELGPDRRIGVPLDWRASMDALESALPHMRGPIESTRKAYALADVSKKVPRMPPLLLLGPPGVGKTHFAHRVGAMLGVTRAMVQMAQPTAGCDLLGSDAHWSTSRTGILFDTLCLGEHANPVVLLDEVDKAVSGSVRVDATAQLHAVLERETSRRLTDVSVGIEFDGSLVMYLATANDCRTIPPSVLSRFDVHPIAPPRDADAYAIASAIAREAIGEHGLAGSVLFERRALALLAHLSPRRMQRVCERALGAAMLEERDVITEDAVWREFDGGAGAPALH
jgi:ATP-dependent Lon protease